MADPKKELTQDEYNALVAMVKRGKEVRVAGRLVKTLDTLNEALDQKEAYDALVTQIEAGRMIHLHGRTALTLDELHFALNAKPAGPIEYVPAGVPMILGFGEQADANALQATIDAQNATLLEMKANAQADAVEKSALQSELVCAKEAYTTENTLATALQTQVNDLTQQRDERDKAVVELRAQIEAMEQKAALAAVEAEKEAQEQSSLSADAVPDPAAASVPASPPPPVKE